MKKILKTFALRGLLFSNGGPLIYAIVLLILHLCKVEITLTVIDVFKGVISTSIMAYLIAGISVVWQLERLGMGLSILIHGTTLYICYLATYLINKWLPFDTLSIGIFSAIFIGTYVLIWLIIYIIEKKRAKTLNDLMHT